MIEQLKSLFDLLVGHIHQYTNIVSKGDPVVNGLATMAVLSAVLFMARKLPGTVFNILLNQFTLTYTLRASSENWENLVILNKISKNMMQMTKKVRRFNISVDFHQGQRDPSVILSPGDGLIFFRYKTGFVLSYRTSGIDNGKVNSTLFIRTIFLRQKDFDNLLVFAKEEQRFFFSVSQSESSVVAVSPIERKKAYNIDPAIKAEIDQLLDGMAENELFFSERCLSNKLNFLFYGPPGTGKTTILCYISQKTNRDILLINNPGVLGNGAIISFISKKQPIVAVEDITESGMALGSQVVQEYGDQADKKRKEKSLSSLLNFLDGANTPNNRIVFMSTNHIDQINDAVLRHNRIDMKCLVDYNKKKDFERVFKFYYHDSKVPEVRLPDNLKFTNAQAANFFKRHLKDPEAWVSEILAESAVINAKLLNPTPVEQEEAVSQ